MEGQELRAFFNSSNPSRTLDMGNPDDRKYYIDFSSVRGSEMIGELGRTIKLSDENTCQLFTGHMGCGKSTELLRLKANLEDDGFHVVYFESDIHLDVTDIDISDILLAIARQVSESLKTIKIVLKANYFANLFHEITEFLQTPLELGTVELSVGIAKITAEAQQSPVLRHQLREILEPRTTNLLESINHDILEKATAKLKEQGSKGLVVLVDNLDRVEARSVHSEKNLQEYLFIDRGAQLRRLNCHIVYTIPLALTFSSHIETLSNYLQDPKRLPMIPVKFRDGNNYQDSIHFLSQMVLARAFPNLSETQRLKRITQVFDVPETLVRLCQISGGHARSLFRLLYRCLQMQDPPISRKCLENAIIARREQLRTIPKESEWNLLHQVSQQKWLGSVQAEELSLLNYQLVFEYQDAQGYWFDINPILAEAQEMRV